MGSYLRKSRLWIFTSPSVMGSASKKNVALFAMITTGTLPGGARIWSWGGRARNSILELLLTNRLRHSSSVQGSIIGAIEQSALFDWMKSFAVWFELFFAPWLMA